MFPFKDYDATSSTLSRCKVTPSGQRLPCCDFGLFYANPNSPSPCSDEFVVPLQDVSVQVQIEDCLAVATIALNYVNSTSYVPVQCHYAIPIRDDKILACKMTSMLDGNPFETQLKMAPSTLTPAHPQNKEAKLNGFEPRTRDESGVARTENAVKVGLGTLYPGQVLSVKIQVIMRLTTMCTTRGFLLPQAFYPDYAMHGAAKA